MKRTGLRSSRRLEEETLIIAAITLLSAVAAQVPTLTDIQMHLWYETTGRLSPDLTQQPGFVGRNVIIGAGSAEEPADDLLIVVELKTLNEAQINTPVRVVATNGKGKILASRTFRHFLIEKGQTHLPLLLRDVGCIGDIKVTARFGRQHRTESFWLGCGE